MPTSGNYNFTLNRDGIITLAFQLINVYDLQDTPSTTDINFAANLLNGIVKVWETEGIKLWKRKQGYLFPALNQSSYQLGSISGSDNCTNSYIATTIAVAAANNASTIALTSVTGMAVNDNIGIELDNGIRYWTTITAINTGTKVITLANNITNTAAVNNTVITYTTKLNRPLQLINATVLDLKSNNTESLIQLIGHDEYKAFPVKNTAGKPNNIYYDKQINNALPYSGTLYLFPTPNLVSWIITFEYLDSIQDFTNSTDTMDLPQEWLYPLAFGLAVELGYAYGKFIELEKIEPHAQQLKQALMNFDSDTESLQIRLNNDY